MSYLILLTDYYHPHNSEITFFTFFIFENTKCGVQKSEPGAGVMVWEKSRINLKLLRPTGQAPAPQTALKKNYVSKLYLCYSTMYLYILCILLVYILFRLPMEELV